MDEIEDQVIDLLVVQTNSPKSKITMDTSIITDLGVFGDDADDLFREFDEQFGTDSSRLNYEKYFGHEGMWPWETALTLCSLAWALLRMIAGKRLANARRSDDDMKVSDLVEAAVKKKWNKRFEQTL